MNFAGTLLKFFNKGGPVMYPLLILSIIGLAAIIERYIVLYKSRANVNEMIGKVRAAVLKKDLEAAITNTEEYKGPVAAVIKAGLLRADHPREEVEKVLQNAALQEINRLERRFGVLATVSNIAPLLGFLGTVTGMINSFEELARQGLGNPGAVAVGISEALITTASGLIIAIPILAAYNHLTLVVTKYTQETEACANILLETLGEVEVRGVQSA